MNGSNHTLGTDIKEWDKNLNSNHNTFSKWGVIKHSVPQGSILCHLLFLLFIQI